MSHFYARVASHDDAGVITQAQSAGLVRNPAFQLAALASRKDARKAFAAPMDPARPGPRDAAKPALGQRARAASPGPA